MEIDISEGSALDELYLRLRAQCLKEVPTVDNWKKTKMSKHVVHHVLNGWYPATLCNIIKEEYPEWFI